MNDELLEALAAEVRDYIDLRMAQLPPGPPGQRGDAGERGIDGRDGRDGRDGKDSDVSRAELELLVREAVTRAVADTLATVAFVGRELRMGELVLAKLATFGWRDVWAPGTPYEPGDVVAWGGNSYVCAEPNSDKPDQNDRAWKMLARKGRDGKDRTK